MSATGMISRVFEHPDSGGVAILEMPSAWSRNSYYTIRLVSAGCAPEVKQFSSPQEARAQAVEHERRALQNGWVPASRATRARAGQESATLHLAESGRMLAKVDEFNVDQRVFGEHDYQDTTVSVVLSGQHDLWSCMGGKLLLRSGNRTIPFNLESARFEAGKRRTFARGAICPVWQFELDAIERWQDSEEVVSEYAETTEDFRTLWELLTYRISDPEKRQRTIGEILARRTALQRQVIERERVEEAARREAEALEARLRREESGRFRPARAQPAFKPEDKLKLSGGVDLTKPRKRKINLGD